MRSEQNLAYPAGAQEGRHLRFPPSCESPLSLRKHGEIFRTETIKERQRIFSTVGADQCVRPFLDLYAMPDSLLLHISATLRRRGMTVPRNSFVGCSLCIPSNFTFIFHSPVSIFNLVLFTLNSPLFTLYKTPISSLLTPALHNLSHLDTCILRQLLLSYKDVRSD